jgi:ferrous iron transport protein B
MTDTKTALPTEHCETCPAFYQLEQMGIKVGDFDRVVALAGNPNTGKSTLFNSLTGLKQHTGNWPGKTVTRAEGGYQFNSVKYKLVDLPGTYSLLSASQDEEVARDFILFGQPDCTIVVTDATALERNLNLVMQVMEITDRVVVAINLMDEAKRKGLEVDARSLTRDLGVPAVPITARTGEGIHTLIATVADLINGDIAVQPLRVGGTPEFQKAINELAPMIEQMAPGIPNARWLAIRLLDGDARVQKAITSEELSEIVARQRRVDVQFSKKMSVEGRQ